MNHVTQISSQIPAIEPADLPTNYAPLTNLGLGLRTFAVCAEAPPSSPRIGLFYGFSGYGKTSAAAFIAARRNVASIRANSWWTSKSLLESLAEELGISRPGRTIAALFKQVVDHLQSHPMDLIIDEGDYLVSRGMIPLVRDIHDNTNCAIMLIGEEAFPAKLKQWEQFDNRILVATPAQPASAQDALLLRDAYCNRVRIADDLVDRFRVATRGVTRRIVTNLKEAQKQAIDAGRDEIDLAWWGTRPISTGDTPTRRQLGA